MHHSINRAICLVYRQKGENWDTRITTELSDSHFGIVCLTPDNIKAPWVHFEAGAISQKFESRVSAFMIGLNPSDLQGPLSRFQATKVEKRDFLALTESINKALEKPIDSELLTNTFNMAWIQLEREINDVVESYQPSKIDDEKDDSESNSIAIEEILSLVRRQNNLLVNPERLIPEDYLYNIFGKASRNKYFSELELQSHIILIEELTIWVERVVNNAFEHGLEIMEIIEIERLMDILWRSTKKFPTSQRSRFLNNLKGATSGKIPILNNRDFFAITVYSVKYNFTQYSTSVFIILLHI